MDAFSRRPKNPATAGTAHVPRRRSTAFRCSARSESMRRARRSSGSSGFTTIVAIKVGRFFLEEPARPISELLTWMNSQPTSVRMATSMPRRSSSAVEMRTSRSHSGHAPGGKRCRVSTTRRSCLWPRSLATSPKACLVRACGEELCSIFLRALSAWWAARSSAKRRRACEPRPMTPPGTRL